MGEVVRPSLPENCITVLVTLDRKPKTEMDKEAAARIQSAEAKKNDGKVEKGGFAPRAQRAADKNEAAKDEEGKWAWIR